LIAGQKMPRRSGDASFHLVERGYGRFARVVRLTTACDMRSRASDADVRRVPHHGAKLKSVVAASSRIAITGEPPVA
jgi:hypothetical protein